MTKPKTRLRFGQKAIVPIEFAVEADRARGVVSIVAQSPRKAPASLVAALPEDYRPAKGQVVYYVPIVITNESTSNLFGAPPPMLVAKLRSGRDLAQGPTRRDPVRRPALRLRQRVHRDEPDYNKSYNLGPITWR